MESSSSKEQGMLEAGCNTARESLVVLNNQFEQTKSNYP